MLFLIAASAPLAAGADDGIVDVHTLPRLEGAVEDTSRPRSYRLELPHSDPGIRHISRRRRKLIGDGWVNM